MKALNNPPLPAVRAIILNANQQILILKRSPGDSFGERWCLPGGKVDYGQSAEEAIIREIFEETSLQGSPPGFLFYMDGLPVEQGNQHYLTLFFLVDVTGSIRLNEESSEFAWVDAASLDQFAFAFDTEMAIRRWLKG
jgi:8-oxo-dGTP diphosphatase